MGIWDLFKGTGKAAAKPGQAKAQGPITVYDERGRELQISRQDWLRSVFLPALERDWNDADTLYGRIIVVGSVVEGGIRIEAWDCKAGQHISEHRVTGALTDLGPLAVELAQQLEQSLLTRGLVTRRARSERFREPPAHLANAYVLAHEQLFYQTLAANEITQASGFFNERSFFETSFGVCEAWPDPPDNAQMLAVCSAVMGSVYKSSIVAPYRKLVLSWIEEAKSGSALYAVAPAVLRRFGEQQLLDAWLTRNQNAPVGSEQAAWLARVREATS